MRHIAALAALLIGVCVFAADPARWTEVVGGAWHPDAVMVAQMDEALQAPVGKQAQQRGGLKPWPQYSFQYQGRTTLLGKRYVYVNAFCNHERVGLDRVWVEVLDGGACFFQAKYEPEKRIVYDLAVNGVA
jgi:hypothetical protein